MSGFVDVKPVSIHAPAGGATYHGPTKHYVCIVSIHAPAGGATVFSFYSTFDLFVSIHAPAGGATLGISIDSLRGVCFNPRSRGGSDDKDTWAGYPFDVSIHAPAGGATPMPGRLLTGKVFQSTLPRGERQLIHDNGPYW